MKTSKLASLLRLDDGEESEGEQPEEVEEEDALDTSSLDILMRSKPVVFKR